MKRLFVIILTIIILSTIFTGCKSEQEKAIDRMREANSAYQQEKDKLDDLNRQLDEVRRKIAAAEK